MKDIEEIYLRDKLADLAGEAERAVAEAVLEIQSKANKAGALGSGMCKMLIERAVLDGFKSHLHNVSRFLIELDINRTDAAKTAFLNSASAFGDTLIATYQYQLFGNSSFDRPKITNEAVRRKSLTSKFADTAWLIMADMEQNVVDKELVMTDAGRRAAELRNDLSPLNIHPDVLRFCSDELLSDNYFHAILEAAKSVAEKLRQKTGLTEDGACLVDRAFGGSTPILAINPLSNESEKSEQRGFMNLVKGAFGMFRNTTAHAPKILWNVNKENAEEALALLSMIHKRIDTACRTITPSHLP